MEQNKKHTRKPIRRILFGLFCYLLLAFLLYTTQFFASCLQHYDNFVAELKQIRELLPTDQLNAELEQSVEEFYKQDLQEAALLLSGNELSNERLAVVLEYLGFPSGIAIFQEDCTPLYTYGDMTDDLDFLTRLLSSGSEKAENGFPYRSIPFGSDLYLAVSFPIDLFEMGYQSESFSVETVQEFTPGMSNDILIADRETNCLIYGPDDMIGKQLTDLLLSASIELPFLHIMSIGDTLLTTAVVESADYLLLSPIDLSSLFQNLDSAITPALFGFGFLIFLLLVYTEFIRTDMGIGRLGKIHYIKIGKKRYLNTMLLRKLSGFALIGISCMVCIIYCIQMLIRSSEQRANAEHRLSIAVQLLEENQENIAIIEKLEKEILLEAAKDIKALLSLNPMLLSDEGLNSISRLFDVTDIYVLDETGKTEFSSSDTQTVMLSNNSTDATYSFWDVVNGFDTGHVQLVPNDPFNQDKDMMYVGIPDTDRRGMILCTYPYDSTNRWQREYDTQMALKLVGLDSQSLLLALPVGSDICAFDSSDQYTGLSLDAYGLADVFRRNGYSGTHMFDGKNCLITTRSVLNWNLIYITPTSWISTSSWLFTAMVVLTGLLVAIIAVLPWLAVRTPGDDLRRPARREDLVSHRSHVDATVTRDGVELAESRVEQNSLRRRWRRMNSSEKLIYLIRVIALLVGGNLLFFFLFRVSAGDYPLIDLILERNWDKSLNIYSLTYVIITVSSIWLVAKLLQGITLFVTGTFSLRWKTLGILISNVIRYAALIASIFFTLQNFGVETSALITSASVLTLVFGLGCQSFVADMVAGVFLIFEGTFRVGDIVMVDNWRGEVVEIGLRSTNVKNDLGNIKVFQNSRISGAINLTRDLTRAVCDIPLPPGEPLKAFEERLTSDFFIVARENIRTIRPPLKYEGVVAVNGDNATLRFSVKCLESEREQIQRELYRELKLWRERTKAAAN